eukprot:5975446-Lingulodinium_polyedra.AAC.1
MAGLRVHSGLRQAACGGAGSREEDTMSTSTMSCLAGPDGAEADRILEPLAEAIQEGQRRSRSWRVAWRQ